MPRENFPTLYKTASPRLNTRSALGIRSVSVSMPTDMLDMFKQISAEREAKTGEKVPLTDLYNEAVEAFIVDLEKRPKKIKFASTPQRGTVRRTIWLQGRTMEDLTELRNQHNILASNFVLTALLRFFSKRDITFEGFPEV